ncbi:acetyl-CoA C-acetyltransferase [Pelagibacterium halotolerans]|uniref:Beta-ketothiolase n=1 Tax=Pelagibacterium halotolerans (strain DSM 22347 / JCM 15775 / CGMCC 1.7692 / B2) TaxID=1082931 RepID=G4R7M2_PELHB|nr:acetyl-CoA C-acetyltransferase [Pelagibacterium halotolerans]AEQ52326.1 3-ketoacyl-CoA thiolase / acetyl-CoA acetyltransferase [Pelagibacterium halotolerans B2]SEA33351.1 acetyl-CoA acetyltransferase [Pelagibacterium halotolerans]
MAPQIHIAAARRTPIGSLNGSLSALAAHELGAVAAKAAIADAGISPEHVEEAIMGQVLTAAAGMNPARQMARLAGMADGATAFVVNQVCGSGLRAVALGAQQIGLGDADVVLAGGQESMSRAPHAAYLRSGTKLGDVGFIDTVMRDGLTDAFGKMAMGVTAENVVRQCGLTREQQDQFALRSQQRASAAQRAGKFSGEIVPVTIAGRKGETVVDQDEFIRHDASLESMEKLRPAFEKDGTVTAGNSSGINDGAAALVLMSEAALAEHGAKSLARIVSWATAGLDPDVMGLGPIPASRKALEKAGWSVADVDLWEANEAFAAQSLAVVGELDVDPERVNVNGGAIALGHPIGASGARVLVTLLHEMARRDVKRGVATLCIGGGMGIAMCVER